MKASRAALLGAVALASCSSMARTAYEQTYQASGANWTFREHFARADHLFNGFDYGHAIVYETLLTRQDAPVRLEGAEFAFITQRLLRHPPRVPLEEAAIGPDYVRLMPEVAAMFAWAHMLHRQLYDVLSCSWDSDARRDRAVARAIAYYESRPDLALSSAELPMSLMEGQPYSLIFRRQDPKFNGLLWSYHWLQMALYDALLTTGTNARVHEAVDSTVNVFFQMLDEAPAHMPTAMPMSADVAPNFSARYPEAAAIFDNLHALHDVVADILASPTIPHNRKREALIAAATVYRGARAK
jgi:hypothetical protein